MAAREVHRRPGGRSARVRRDVLNATLELIRSEGVDQVTVAKVAGAAGVNATSIYRRWGTREHLILDAATGEQQREVEVPDTGSLLGDLTEYLTSVSRYLSSPRGTALVRAMATAADNPEMWSEHEKYVEHRLPHFQVILDRAVQRGEITGPIDTRTVLDACISPFQVRALMHENFDQAMPRAIARLVASGLAAPL